MKFNPETVYNWQPEDQFQISGKDLEIIYNANKGLINRLMEEDTMTLKPTDLVALIEAYRCLEARFISYVESDQIKPATVTEEVHVMD